MFTWAILTPILLDLAKRFLAPWMMKLLEKLLPTSSEAIAADAPQELKDVIIKFLLDKVKMLNRPILGIALSRLIPALVDAIFDMAWDMLFAKGLVGKMAAEFKPQLMQTESAPEGLELELDTL